MEYLHALRPQHDCEDDHCRDDDGEGGPDALSEEGSLGRDAEVADEDGHLDEAGREDEERLARHGSLPMIRNRDGELDATDVPSAPSPSAISSCPRRGCSSHTIELLRWSV